MSQTQQDIQLKVWKELAISKQVLMRAATDALKLDPECSQEELKAALEGALQKVAKADADLFNAKEQARAAIAALEKKLADTEQALAAAQKSATDSQAAHDGVVQQMANQRAAAATELQKVKDRLAERDKQLKAINTALADTPENVLKKMNTFKKQKQEESDARRQIETELNKLRNEKRQQDTKLTELQRNGTTLVGRYKDLHAVAMQMQDQLKPLVQDAKSVPEVAPIDTTLLEAIDPNEKSDKDKGAKRAAR